MRPGAERLGRSRILLVDDDLPLLRRISSYLSLELGLEVETAPNGSRALEMLQTRSYRFLLTDIRMPGMPWFDLVQFVRENRPDTRYALLTGFEVDNFLQYALEYDVGTILSKDSPQLLDEIGDAIEALLTEDVFGLEKWLGPGAEVHARQIRRAEEIPDAARAVASWFAPDGFDRIFRRVLQEVLTNAVYYGSLGEDGDRKPEWETELVLARDQVVYVFFGRSDTHVGCSVVDRGGRLSKTEILRWLVRNTTRNADGLMLSTDFTHGRGLHITRRSLERVIFNTRRADRTEVILLQGTVANSQQGRPLLIHEF